MGVGQDAEPATTAVIMVPTARRCSKGASGLALDADVIRMTPVIEEALVLRRSDATTEIATPEWALLRNVPQRVKQPGAAMNTKKPLQPRRNSDLKFFVLCVGITLDFSRGGP